MLIQISYKRSPMTILAAVPITRPITYIYFLSKISSKDPSITPDVRDDPSGCTRTIGSKRNTARVNKKKALSVAEWLEAERRRPVLKGEPPVRKSAAKGRARARECTWPSFASPLLHNVRACACV